MARCASVVMSARGGVRWGRRRASACAEVVCRFGSPFSFCALERVLVLDLDETCGSATGDDYKCLGEIMIKKT